MSCCRDGFAKRVAIDLERKGLTAEAHALEQIEADKWEGGPKGWTNESKKKFWNSLTGDKKHKITECMKKMKGKVSDPGAFCGGLASRVGYR